MTDDQRHQLRTLLEQREADLQGTVDQLRTAIAGPSGMPEVRDSVEDGDARMMATLDLTQLGRQEQELLEVRAALQRMDEGVYGRCEQCDEPIPFARLQVRPEARLCIRDEENWERTHPQGGTPA